MFAYSISLIGLLLLSCIVQQFLPTVSVWHNAHILLMPLVILCGSITVPTAVMLILTFIGGFIWDAQQVLLIDHGDPEVYQNSPDSLKFGYTIVLYALMGFLMQGIRPLFRQGKWYLSAVLTGVAIFLYLSVEYLLRAFIFGGFAFDNGMFEQIGASSLLTMCCSPFIFWVLFRIADLCGHQVFDDH